MNDFQLPSLNNHKNFEYLLCDMFNEQYNTHSFKCYGKQGHRQYGIDILSPELGIIVQCKNKDLTRTASSLKNEILNDIKETLSSLSPEQSVSFNMIYIASNISEHPDYDNLCSKLTNSTSYKCIFLGWETIQRRLSNLPLTLLKYFPQFISTLQTAPVEDLSWLAMRKRLKSDLSLWLDYSIENRTRRSRMIIHSTSDTAYPEHELNKEGKYQWFGKELYKAHHNGLSFFDDSIVIYINSNNRWTDIEPVTLQGYTVMSANTMRIIDYKDIIDYDVKGDDHYLCPHFYCLFRHNGEPFSQTFYIPINKDGKRVPYTFDDSTKIDL